MTTHGADRSTPDQLPARSQSTTHAITPSVTTTSVGIGIACQAIDAIERFGSATTGGRPSRTADGPRRSRARSAVPRRPTRAACVATPDRLGSGQRSVSAQRSGHRHRPGAGAAATRAEPEVGDRPVRPEVWQADQPADDQRVDAPRQGPTGTMRSSGDRPRIAEVIGGPGPIGCRASGVHAVATR